ncbi:hypothetical protein VNO77_04386 [Canavalia gladiata]|uniref:Uncharacterized protein n=1 Tax=Canavalia gladiata TaxID=3824 RepID=A0AAN9MYG8_CANGL
MSSLPTSISFPSLDFTWSATLEDCHNWKGCFVGVLRCPKDLSDPCDKLVGEGLFSVSLITLGGSEVVLKAHDGEDLSALVWDLPGVFSHWFLDLHPWKPEGIPSDRLVWLPPCVAVRVYSLSGPMGTFVDINGLKLPIRIVEESFFDVRKQLTELTLTLTMLQPPLFLILQLIPCNRTATIACNVRKETVRLLRCWKSGGLLLIWDQTRFSLSSQFFGPSFLGVVLQGSELKPWAKQSLGGRFWCMAGDFNAVCDLKERGGLSMMTSSLSMDQFNSYLEEWKLEGLPTLGCRFTWMNVGGTSMSKLDRSFPSGVDGNTQDWVLDSLSFSIHGKMSLLFIVRLKVPEDSDEEKDLEISHLQGRVYQNFDYHIVVRSHTLAARFSAVARQFMKVGPLLILLFPFLKIFVNGLPAWIIHLAGCILFLLCPSRFTSNPVNTLARRLLSATVEGT